MIVIVILILVLIVSIIANAGGISLVQDLIANLSDLWYNMALHWKFIIVCLAIFVAYYLYAILTSDNK